MKYKPGKKHPWRTGYIPSAHPVMDDKDIPTMDDLDYLPVRSDEDIVSEYRKEPDYE